MKAWTQLEERRAKELYDQGLSYPQIGKEIGRSADSVKGLGARHLWPTRAGKERVAKPRAIPKPKPVVVESNRSTCRWPLWNEGDKDHRYCGQKSEGPGKTYCKEHADIAYARRR